MTTHEFAARARDLRADMEAAGHALTVEESEFLFALGGVAWANTLGDHEGAAATERMARRLALDVPRVEA